jgi:putative sigma-54 modulation protein
VAAAQHSVSIAPVGAIVDVDIQASHVELPEEVRAMAISKVGRLDRFLEGMERAEVRFHEERNPRIAEKEVCEVTVRGHGHVVRAEDSATDPLVALDQVLDKAEHQLEKLKGRLVGRSHPRPGSRRPASRASSDPSELEQEAQGTGRIVKVKSFAIKPMTPEEAVLQMELLSHDFFFFTNVETGRPAVAYLRSDGDIGLIDSE